MVFIMLQLSEVNKDRNYLVLVILHYSLGTEKRLNQYDINVGKCRSHIIIEIICWQLVREQIAWDDKR